MKLRQRLHKLRERLLGRARPEPQPTQERWTRISELVDEALRRPDPAERARYLREACASDTSLRQEVDRLLSYENAASGILAGPLWGRLSTGPEKQPAPEPTLHPGQEIGHYRVEKLLGDGGMGTVALAYDAVLDRQVALKVIRREKNSPEMLRRFDTERRVLARLDHPAIARLFEAGQVDGAQGIPYFTLEYVDGEPIDVFCDRHRLDLPARLELMIVVCDALSEAHRLLVVHRDIKPANVLVVAEGQPKLLDFGIAKELDGMETAGAGLTRTGEQPLTPAWASPEQVRGLPVGVATDIYGVGLLLYQLLCGHPPYLLDGDAFENARRICEEEPLPPSRQAMVTLEVWRDGAPEAVAPEILATARRTEPRQLRRQLRGDLDAIVLKALAKDPAQRYRSIQDLRDDLARHLGSLPVSVRQGSSRYRLGKLLRRRWRGLILAAGAFGLLAGVATMLMESRARAAVAESEKLRAAEVADQAERQAEAITGFARNLVLATDPDHPQPPAASEILARAQASAEKSLAAEPEALSHQLEALGLAYRALGDLKSARQLLETSLRLRRQVYGRGDHPLVARGLNNLGSVWHEAGERAAAEQLYRLALEMKRRLGQAPVELARVENNLASLLAFRGELTEAEAMYRRVLAVRQAGTGDPAEIATSLRSLGNVLYLAAKFEDSEAILRQALELRGKEHGIASLRTAAVWSTLGRVLHAQGRLSEARQALEQVLEARLARLGEKHQHVALSRKDLASVLFDLGEVGLAEELWAKAMVVLREEPDENAWELADADSQEGERWLAAGRISEAAEKLERGYAVLRRLRGEDSLHTRQARERLERLRSLARSL